MYKLILIFSFIIILITNINLIELYFKLTNLSILFDLFSFAYYCLDSNIRIQVNKSMILPILLLTPTEQSILACGLYMLATLLKKALRDLKNFINIDFCHC